MEEEEEEAGVTALAKAEVMAFVLNRSVGNEEKRKLLPFRSIVGIC